MFDQKTLRDYAKLVLKYGVNLQKGQGLEILCPIECSLAGEIFTEEAYIYGAKEVRIRWESEKVSRLNLIYKDEQTLNEVPKWFVDSKMDLVDKNFCYIAIASDTPSCYKDIDAKKLGVYSKARSKALKKYSDVVMANGIRWCVISLPTKDWAEEVFDGDKNSLTKLAECIKHSMRLDVENPQLAWQEHIDKLDQRAKILNDYDFEYIHFKNNSGTDIKVGLADGHQWLSAKEKAKDGIDFVANMPTEEIFTAPHRLKVDGVLHSALPLCENGQIIDDFSITFKKGKIVDFSASKGYDVLKNLIDTDEGTKRLGEVALIDKYSPIAQSNVLFLNTLFDENASCHLAIGKAYPTTHKEGDVLTSKELKARGLNDSIEHVDFMIGTPDICVYGIKKDGEKIELILDGEWQI